MLIETMLWDGVFPLLEFHLDRVMDSAEYFGSASERDAVKAALMSMRRLSRWRAAQSAIAGGRGWRAAYFK